MKKDIFTLSSVSDREIAATPSVRDLLAAAQAVQTVTSVGRPSDAFRLGAQIVDEHAEALRRLADA